MAVSLPLGSTTFMLHHFTLEVPCPGSKNRKAVLSRTAILALAQFHAHSGTYLQPAAALQSDRPPKGNLGVRITAGCNTPANTPVGVREH